MSLSVGILPQLSSHFSTHINAFSMNAYLGLPEEILCHVLSDLKIEDISSAILVCKLWLFLCSRRVHFKLINVVDYYYNRPPNLIFIYKIKKLKWSCNVRFLMNVLEKYNLESIDLRHADVSIPLKLLSISGDFSILTSLSIKSTESEKSTYNPFINWRLYWILPKCEILSSLELTDIDFNDHVMTKVPTTLKIISITANIEMTDASLKHISKRCPGLEKITLVHIPNITDAGVREISEKCKGLVYAELTSVSVIQDVLSIVDLITKTQIRECGNLRVDFLMHEKLKDYALCKKDKEISIIINNLYGIRESKTLPLCKNQKIVSASI